MKIALTVSSQDINAPLDQRFGRAGVFLIYDLENDTYEWADNKQNLNSSQGAGIQAALKVLEAGAEALITGNCGPKAFKVMSESGARVYHCDAPTVKEALRLYRSGMLKEADAANVEGHWI